MLKSKVDYAKLDYLPCLDVKWKLWADARCVPPARVLRSRAGSKREAVVTVHQTAPVGAPLVVERHA
jgi:hypothetical protein